jgi:hypothetical protein
MPASFHRWSLRALPALLLVAVVGCSSSTITGDPSDDSGTEAGLDAPDGYIDVITEPVADIPNDMGSEGTDMSPDVEPDVGCEGILGGPCNLVGQCRCPESRCLAGQYCGYRVGGGSCFFTEDYSLIHETMVLEEGSYCDDWDQCSVGTTCWNLRRHGFGYCYRWCLTDHDCPREGTTCDVEPLFDAHVGCTASSTPYKFCTLP